MPQNMILEKQMNPNQCFVSINTSDIMADAIRGLSLHQVGCLAPIVMLKGDPLSLGAVAGTGKPV